MDGLFFIWCSWIVVIYLLFFVYPKRKFVLIHTLLLVFLSQFLFQYDEWIVNSSIVYLFVITIVYIARQPANERMRMYAVSFILAVLQASYYLFSILEPLWFLWIPSWLNPFLLVYVCALLVQQNGNRILSLIMGKIISDILIFVVHLHNHLQYEILQLSWLDQLAMVMVLLFIWSMMESVGKYVLNPSRHTQKKEV